MYCTPILLIKLLIICIIDVKKKDRFVCKLHFTKCRITEIIHILYRPVNVFAFEITNLTPWKRLITVWLKNIILLLII